MSEATDKFLIQEGIINKASLDTIVRLTKERNLAREDCGFQKGLKEHIRSELDTFIRLRREAIAERDQAQAALAKVRAIIADPHAALVVDRIRAALEETT